MNIKKIINNKHLSESRRHGSKTYRSVATSCKYDVAIFYSTIHGESIEYPHHNWKIQHFNNQLCQLRNNQNHPRRESVTRELAHE